MSINCANVNKVIEGEASETDSDDEVHIKNKKVKGSIMTKSVQGAIIAGEASESEDEHGSSISSAVSALTQPKVRGAKEVKTDEKFNSLLHKKLKERNRSLHDNLHTFMHNTINEAARDLTSIDQHLLKSQVTLQAAVTSLRSLGQNSLALKEKLDTIVSSKFLDTVRAPTSDCYM